MELPAVLEPLESAEALKIEAPYPIRYPGKARADLSFRVDGKTWYVELKTANINWSATGIKDKIRPITPNMGGIISDMAKLRESCPPA